MKEMEVSRFERKALTFESESILAECYRLSVILITFFPDCSCGRVQGVVSASFRQASQSVLQFFAQVHN